MTAKGHALPLSRLLAEAARCVQAVRDGRSLDVALSRVDAEARPGAQALSFEALRRLGSATLLRQGLVTRAPAPDMEALLLVSLSLLCAPPGAQTYAPHTLVDEAVKAAARRQARSGGFVNAVMRRYLRERAAWDARIASDLQAHFNHPAWWIRRLQDDWPDAWQTLLVQSHQAPPMTLRVNRLRSTTPQYLDMLDGAGHRAMPLAWVPQGMPALALSGTIVLDRPCPVERLPGFDQGLVSVQDGAAQLAAPLLLDGRSLGKGLRVLDACAAPGGKTAHLLELDPSLQVTALDVDASRLQRVGATLERLGLKATLLAADAGQPSAWWDGRVFDAILLDAPCTASGIVRRHPDIPWLRRESDVAALAATQARLLDALWPLLAPGGVMVYATCSLFKAEGSAQIDAFLQRVPGPSPALDPASAGHLRPLPDNSNQATAAHDGFFYARLTKPLA